MTGKWHLHHHPLAAMIPAQPCCMPDKYSLRTAQFDTDALDSAGEQGRERDGRRIVAG